MVRVFLTQVNHTDGEPIDDIIAYLTQDYCLSEVAILFRALKPTFISMRLTQSDYNVCWLYKYSDFNSL